MGAAVMRCACCNVSVLFNESKLLKLCLRSGLAGTTCRFSTLQRVEIAEIFDSQRRFNPTLAVSVLFNESKLLKLWYAIVTIINYHSFSALQRAEIAEIAPSTRTPNSQTDVSVLFNEPKLLKSKLTTSNCRARQAFQCSSTSRNC